MKKRPRFGPFKNIWHLLQKYLKLASFSFIFVVSNNTIISANVCEKCPSSIRCCDLNPQPSEGESPPITSTKIGCFILYFCIACHLIRQTRKTQFVPVKQKNIFVHLDLFKKTSSFDWFMIKNEELSQFFKKWTIHGLFLFSIVLFKQHKKLWTSAGFELWSS